MKFVNVHYKKFLAKIAIIVISFFIFTSGFAQSLGEYVFPFENRKLPKLSSGNYFNPEEALDQLFTEEIYGEIKFKLEHTTRSLGGLHYTYQVFFQNYRMEQCLVKIHTDLHSKIRLLQTNLPTTDQWNQFQFIFSAREGNQGLIVQNDQLVPVKIEEIQNEKIDDYAKRFWINNVEYYENNLKYHIDTSVYARVFLPDPLSSSGMLYGGNFQDTYSFDTSALVIQNINNPGGNTVLANSTTYNYDGQSFNIPSESYINNFSNAILYQVFESIFLDGQGTILGFNTAITEDFSSYTSSVNIEDYNYTALAQEQSWVSMPADFSNGTFNLLNDFFIISEFSVPQTNPSISLVDSFNYSRNQIEFEDVNAFYHLNNYKSYWESLGFTDLASQIILVDAHGNSGADNSFFTPTTPPRLVFGQGGVDDAEDADVVIHEYGHAISYFASPGTNVESQRRALDEGFGDYLASSYSKQFTNFNANNVFSWDGHNEYWSGRISNSNKTALDISAAQSIYFNGEIWSASLNDIYEKIGANNTDKLAIEVMYYNMPNTTITQAAENLFLADTLLFNGIHSCDIFDVLFERKFLLGTCTEFYTGIKTAIEGDETVQLLNSYGFTNYMQDLVLLFKDDMYKNSQVQLIDISGKILQEFSPKSNDHHFNFPEITNGVYYLEVRTKAQNYRFKILKK